MYFDAITVRVRLASGGWLGTDEVEIREEFVETIPVEGDLSIDDSLLEDLQQFVFEQTDRTVPAYMVEFRHKAIEQGASGSLGEFIIELLDLASEEAWKSLGVLVSAFLLERMKRTEDND